MVRTRAERKGQKLQKASHPERKEQRWEWFEPTWSPPGLMEGSQQSTGPPAGMPTGARQASRPGDSLAQDCGQLENTRPPQGVAPPSSC